MHQLMTKLFEAVEMMNELCGDGKRFKNKNKMAKFLELDKNDIPKFYNVLKGKSVPQADTLLEWMERLGFKVLPPWEKSGADSRMELLERADLVMETMRQLGISDAHRACVHDVLMGRRSECSGHYNKRLEIKRCSEGFLLRSGAPLRLIRCSDGCLVEQPEKIEAGAISRN